MTEVGLRGTVTGVQTGPAVERPEPAVPGAAERRFLSAIDKRAVAGSVRVGALGLEGDEHGHPDVHGGPDKAICVYAAPHYAYWESAFGLTSGAGTFGENLTVEGFDEKDVSLGDVFRIGDRDDALQVQISQPRQPCWEVARRWGRKDLPRAMEAHGFTGWYLRVMREGSIEAGDSIVRISRSHPEWTVERANRVMYRRHSDRVAGPRAAAALAALPELAEAWGAPLRARARNAAPGDGVAFDPRDLDPPYVPVDCGFHDVLESVATRGAPVGLRVREEGGDEWTLSARIVDVFAADGADWVRLESGRRIRADHVMVTDGR